MFNRAPSPGRLQLACLCLAVLVGLIFAVRGTRSSHAPLTQSAIPAVAQVAHLTMLNCGHCEWQIALTPAAGGERSAWKVPMGKSLDAALASGDYEVEQTMLTVEIGPDATRRFPLRLEAGQSYRWRLVTLLSGATEDVRLPVQANDGHE